jgi:hypothetical protein
MKIPQKVVRRMGYLRDQRGIMNRYLRESSHWEKHLKLTRSFISSAFTDTFPGKDKKESIAILGSGWLLDVPLEELVRRFGEVYLVDINHPPQIRKKAGHLDHVYLLEEDLSGGAIEQAWQFTSEKGKRPLEELIETITLSPPLSGIDPSAMISVNLLNQLDIIICDHLIKEGHTEEKDLNRIRRIIQSSHLDWITQMPGCLITDTEEINTDKDGNETAKTLLYAGLPEGLRREQWSWEFDTSGSYRPGSRSRMEVKALEWA